MSQQLISAVFENGSFRPLEPLALLFRDGDQVSLLVEQHPTPTSLELAGQVYDGLSNSEIEAVERIALDRSTFFRIPEIE